MQMSNDEIIMRYRQAKKHGEQIQILAELNGCTASEIGAILKAGGIDGRAIAVALGRQKKTAISKISTATVSELTGKAPADFTAVRGRIRYLLEQRKLIDDELAGITAQMHELLKEMEETT